ncbi:2'-5' RNA ligase family protein [Microbacterium sp. NPDC058389]|uniref:2'-5' RNA ligase family protein n=1 Tax=Microbacterium sp. NPDC058389 TaxID=3346475 RepID=UPI00364AA176
MTTHESRELFVVVALPDPLEVGSTFRRRAWPAHVTLASNFAVDGARDAVLSAVRGVCAEEPPLEIRFGDEARFGPRGDIAVQLVESAQIVDLHERLADAVERLEGFAAEEPAHWRGGYRPHMTHVPGVVTPAGARSRLVCIANAVMAGSMATIISTAALVDA